MNSKAIIWALVVVIVVLGGYFLFTNNTEDSTNQTVTPTPMPAPAPAPAPTPTPSTSESPTPIPAPVTVTPKTYDVSITDAGYNPSTLTLKKGDTVKYTNNSSKANWPASAPHPTHTDYPEFDPKKAVAVGATWSFTFTKVGTWKYHDHLNATKFGSITVTE